eukprot:Gb_35935 [translate_table: standard]
MARRNTYNNIGSTNPFDSDEETDGNTSLASRRTAPTPGPEKYTNPFDDNHIEKDRVAKPVIKRVQFESSKRRENIPRSDFQKGIAARNPFSDDEEEPAPSKKDNLASKLENGTLFDNTSASRHTYPEETRHFREDNNEGSRVKKGERFMSQMKGRAGSVGESALKTAEKLKESSVNQAQKIRMKKSNGSSSSEISISSQAKPVDSNLQQRDLLLGDEEKAPSSTFSATRSRYKNDFRDTGGFENQTVQELENYAVYKSEETTATVNNCLKVAENIKEDATKTMLTLHEQGEQITRTHNIAVNIDYDLSAGEKLLGSLGGIFSKKWKPKKTRPINGPILTRDNSFKRRANHLEQRTALGLTRSPKGISHTKTYPLAADTPQTRIEVEKVKQDDALSDLSNVLDQLKEMAIDMGSEIGRQNESIDHLGDDVTELSYRVKGANARGRRLLGK